MPAPSTSPLFSTDATFAADGDDWSGDPTKIDPGAPRRAEGFEPDTLPAEWLNFQIGLIGDWIKWHEDEILGVATRTERFSPWIGEGLASAGGSAWRCQVFSTGLTEGFNLATDANYGRRFLNLSDLLPEGSEVQSVSALVKPGAARAGGPGAEKMELKAFTAITDWTPAVAANAFSNDGTSDVDDGTTGVQVLTIASGVTIARSSTQYVAMLTGGFDAGTNRDLLYGWEVVYSGPKMR